MQCFLQEGLCHCGPKDNCEIVYPTSFGDVLGGNRTTMKGILATYGPVAVGINSAPKSFKFYREGVYDDFDCGRFQNPSSLQIQIIEYPNVHLNFTLCVDKQYVWHKVVLVSSHVYSVSVRR
jgi:hypothetical protein